MLGAGAFAKSHRPVNDLKSDVFGVTGKAVPTPGTKTAVFRPRSTLFQAIAELPSIGPSVVEVCKHKILLMYLGKAVPTLLGSTVYYV
jgi:hypothetical protein